jgi:hypothetical protein
VSNGDTERTVSGLDEAQIDARDLEALRQAVILHRLAMDVPCQLRSMAAASGAQAGGPLKDLTPRLLRLHVTPLPKLGKLKPVSTQLARPRIKQATALAAGLPVERRALPLTMLTVPQEERLERELQQRYGAAADGLRLQALFQNIPPEAAEAIQLDPQLRRAAFRLPAGLNPARTRGGFFLLILSDRENKTKKLLLRLDK